MNSFTSESIDIQYRKAIAFLKSKEYLLSKKILLKLNKVSSPSVKILSPWLLFIKT
ncbi:MAG: hypothetical protein Q9M92_15420 [Enterobacterales bacterium]|nr:hypothetical protein [Enterobacterales bacterium]